MSSFAHLVNICIIPVIAVIGIIGNILQLITNVLQPNCKSQIAPFLLALAANDIVLITVFCMIIPVHAIMGEEAMFNSEYIRCVPFLVAANSFTLMAHIWTTVALTIDRFLAIWAPIWHLTSRPTNQSILFIIPANLFALSFVIPRFLSMEVIEGNGTKYTFQFARLYHEPSYKYGYLVLAKSIFGTGGPILIIIVLTCLMIKRLGVRSSMNDCKKTQKRCDETSFLVIQEQRPSSSKPTYRTEMSPRVHRKTNNATTFQPLIAVIIAAIFCYSIPALLNLVEVFELDKNFPESVSTVATSLSNLFVIVDASCNFYVYLATSASFQKAITNQIRKIMKITEHQESIELNNKTTSSRPK